MSCLRRVRVLPLALVALAVAPAGAPAATPSQGWSQLVSVDATTGKARPLARALSTQLCWGRRGVEAYTQRRRGPLLIVAYAAGRRPVVVHRAPETVLTDVQRAPGCRATAEIHRDLDRGGERRGGLRILDAAGRQTLRHPLSDFRAAGWERVSWSADGRRFASVAHLPDRDVVRVHEVATGRELWTRPVGRDDSLPELPFSADGGRVVIQRGEPGPDGRAQGLAVLDLASGAIAPLAGAPRSGHDGVTWSPRSELIAYANGMLDIELVDAATGTRTVLDTGRLGAVGDLAWSPDGRRIAYRTTPDDRDHSALAVIDARTGARPRALYRGRLQHWQVPVWSPDGRRIAVSRPTREPGAPSPRR